jgi:hypothetical protein
MSRYVFTLGPLIYFWFTYTMVQRGLDSAPSVWGHIPWYPGTLVVGVKEKSTWFPRCHTHRAPEQHGIQLLARKNLHRTSVLVPGPAGRTVLDPVARVVVVVGHSAVPLDAPCPASQGL